MRRKMILVVTVFAMMFVMEGFSGAAEMQAVKIRIHSQMPAGHFVTRAVDMFIAEATKNSKGTLQFTHYPSQQLFSDTQIVDVLPKGGVEMAQINGSLFLGKVPMNALGSLPATCKDLSHYYRYYYDYDKSQAGFKMNEAMEKQANIISVSTLLYSPNTVIMATKPITKIDDFKGTKMRGWGKVLTLILQSWGGTGVVMSSSDVYTGMDRKTIDGVFSGLTSGVSRKWYEVAKNASIIEGFLPAPFNLSANLDFWKKLHPDQKRAIINAAYVAEVWCAKASIADDDKAEELLKSKGVKVYYWPEAEAKILRDKARPIIFEELIKKPLGAEMEKNVEKWVKDTERDKMTWEQACQKNRDYLLSQVK